MTRRMRSTVVSVCVIALLISTLVRASLLHTTPAPEGCPTPASNTANTAGIRSGEVSIDAVTILLPAHVHTPYRTFVVYQPVTAHGGCFTWRTSHPALINIQPIQATKCSERVTQKNPQTGAQEWVTREGYTSVYVSAAASVSPSAADEDPAGQPSAGIGGVGAPFTSNETFQRRLAAWISAHDIAREERFAECEIFIDVIHRLEILTSTRRINVGDVEALQLAAYDSMDNVFSSLDGLPFTWKNTDGTILKEISVAESGLVVAASIWELERSEVESNIHPVRGAIPGRVNMTASLADASHPVSASAEFLVIEPLFLKPASARLCPGSELKVQLLTRFKEERVVHTDRSDDSTAGTAVGATSTETQSSTTPTTSSSNVPSVHRREISMPSAQYKWSSLDSAIAQIDADSGLLTALRTGSTRVRVGDVNLPEHRRESDILVVEPASISVELRSVGGDSSTAASKRRTLCDGSYFIHSGQQVELLIFLLDSQGYRIAITPNMQFGFSTTGTSLVRSKGPENTPTSPLPPHASSSAPPGQTPTPSSSSMYLQGIKEGLTTISVSLTSVKAHGYEYVLKGKDGSPQPLVQSVKISVTNPVTVEGGTAAVRRFPFIAPSLPRYSISATGGSGKYQWVSSNESILRVVPFLPEANSTASVDIQASTLGDATLQVSDLCNPESQSSLPIEIVQPGRPEFFHRAEDGKGARREAVVSTVGQKEKDPHSTIDLYVRLAGGKQLDQCEFLWLHGSFLAGVGIFTMVHGGTENPTNLWQCQNKCPIDESINCFHLKLASTPGKVGLAQLRVNLVDSPSQHSVPLAVSPATAVFSAFSPLQTEPSPLLLAVGSAQRIRHTQGPFAWAQGGFVEEGAQTTGVAKTLLAEAKTAGDAPGYADLLETFFTQTWLHHNNNASSNAVMDRQQLKQAPWLNHDVTAEGFLELRPVQGSKNIFELRCLRATDPLALHVVVSNSRGFGTPSVNPLQNPLAAHSIIHVHCYPSLALAAEPSKVGIGEKAQLKLRDPNHPLASLVRYTVDVQGQEKPVVSVDALKGIMTGLRLGATHVRATVDRVLLLEQLGYPGNTPQPRYTHPDGLQSIHKVTVEFDAFAISLATPTEGMILRGHSTLASVVGAQQSGPSPLDESFEHVQCSWTVDHSGSAGLGLAPPLAHSYLSGSTEEPAEVVYGCAIRLWGLRSGSHTLRVKILVSQPGRYAAVQATFNQSMIVQVVDPLLLLSPSSVILPPGTQHQILTNVGQTNSTGGAYQLRYSVMNDGYVRLVDHSGNVKQPEVIVDERGLISTAATGDQQYLYTADAVILIHHHSNHIKQDMNVFTQFTQTQTVLVQVRPVAQLFVAAAPIQLLCPARNYTLTLGVQDALGRKFDLPRVDEYLTGLQAELSSTAASELPVQIVRTQSVSVGDQLLAAYSLLVAEPNEAVVEGEEAQTLHALQDFTLAFSLPSLPSLYLQFYVASLSMCQEPSPVLLSLKLSIPLKSWVQDYPTNSVHRDSFVATLAQELARALDLPANQFTRVRIVNVDPATGGIEVLLLPKSVATTLQTQQWFMAYFTPAHLASGQQTLIPNEEWLSAPFALAQALQKQAADKTKESKLWQGSLTRLIDARSPFASVELSFHDADRLARERRGPSSTLSSIGSGASGQSVWSDERDYQTWRNVLDSRTSGDVIPAEASISHTGGDIPAESTGHAASETPSTPSVDEAAARERERREEEEAKWKELKRRYELEKMRESAPGDYSSILYTILSTLLSLGVASLALAFGYWKTIIAYQSSVGRRLTQPTDQLRRTPEHSFIVWLMQRLDELFCCRRSREVRPMLIDPQLGPTQRTWQQTASFNQVPPQQIVAPPDTFEHLDYTWNR